MQKDIVWIGVRLWETGYFHNRKNKQVGDYYEVIDKSKANVVKTKLVTYVFFTLICLFLQLYFTSAVFYWNSHLWQNDKIDFYKMHQFTQNPELVNATALDYKMMNDSTFFRKYSGKDIENMKDVECDKDSAKDFR